MYGGNREMQFLKDFEERLRHSRSRSTYKSNSRLLTRALISRENIIRIDNVPRTCGHKGCCYYVPSGEHRSDVSFNLIAHFQSTKLYPTRRFRTSAIFSEHIVFSDQRFLRPFFPRCCIGVFLYLLYVSRLLTIDILSSIILPSELLKYRYIKFRLNGDC